MATTNPCSLHICLGVASPNFRQPWFSISVELSFCNAPSTFPLQSGCSIATPSVNCQMLESLVSAAVFTICVIRDGKATECRLIPLDRGLVVYPNLPWSGSSSGIMNPGSIMPNYIYACPLCARSLTSQFQDERVAAYTSPRTWQRTSSLLRVHLFFILSGPKFR